MRKSKRPTYAEMSDELMLGFEAEDSKFYQRQEAMKQKIKLLASDMSKPDNPTLEEAIHRHFPDMTKGQVKEILIMIENYPKNGGSHGPST